MSSQKRILVVGAVTGGTVPLGQSIRNAFVSLGQQADLLDFSDWLPEFTAVGASGDARRIQTFVMGLRARLLEEVARFQPEIILGMAQSPLNNVEILSRFSKAGIKLCYWFVEDYRLLAYWKNIAAAFDHFYTIQQEPFFTELKAIGCQRASYLPTAFDDLVPAEVPGSRGQVSVSARAAQSIPVSFVGAPYPNRVHWFQRLAGTAFKIYGEGWNREMNPAVARGDRLTPAECQDIYGRTVINLNLHSDVRPEGFGEGDFVNPRAFEIAGLGAFQLTDARQLLSLHFDTAREVPAFHSWREFQSAIEYFLAHEEERKAIAENARRRVLCEHTYRHRAQEMLSHF
jgi:spore maturation protein CgeB